MRESLSTKIETHKVCHALLQNPKFLSLLVQIDAELAAQTHASGCPCGATLHRANYPRKPRGCPKEMRHAFDSRWSFCCSRCRKRVTSTSVRFLGRRVYLGLLVIFVPIRRAHMNAAAAQIVQLLAVPERTIARWRSWWAQQFAATPLWRGASARFMPSICYERLPLSLVERFTGQDAQRALNMLVFLSPMSVQR